MSEAEKKKLLNDKWPVVSEEKKRALMQVIKKASKARVFDYLPEEKELIAEK